MQDNEPKMQLTELFQPPVLTDQSWHQKGFHSFLSSLSLTYHAFLQNNFLQQLFVSPHTCDCKHVIDHINSTFPLPAVHVIRFGTVHEKLTAKQHLSQTEVNLSSRFKCGTLASPFSAFLHPVCIGSRKGCIRIFNWWFLDASKMKQAYLGTH